MQQTEFAVEGRELSRTPGPALAPSHIKNADSADQSLTKPSCNFANPLAALRLQSMRFGDGWAFECWSSAPTVVVASSIKDCWYR